MSDQGTPSAPSRIPSRQIGLLFAMLLGVSAVGLFSAGQSPFSLLAGLYPGSDLFTLLAVTLGFCLILGYAYAAIGAAAPRAGADYVLGSRVLSPGLAFAASFTFVVFSGLLTGSLIAALPQTILPSILQTFAAISGQDLGALAADIATQQGVVTIGTLAVVLAFAANLLKPRQLKILLLVGLVLGLLAWGVLFFQLGSAAPGNFAELWDNALGAGSYLEQIESAQRLGLQNAAAPAFPLAGLLVAFWMVFGYFSPTFFAGEVNKPEKNILGSTWLALLINGALIAVAVWLVQRVVPMEFVTAQSFLGQSSPTAAPFITVYAAVLSPSLPLLVFTGVVWVFLALCAAVAFFFFTSRIIRAWAVDQILPSGISQIHPTRKAPLLPLFFISLLALLGLMDASHPGRLLSPLTYALVTTVCMLIPLISLAALPFARKDWFAQAPRLVRLKLGPLPLVSLAAAVSALYLLWLVISHFIFPGLTKPLSWVDWVAFGVIFGGGFLVYSNRKESLRQNNIELKDAFSQLPQDD